MPTGRGWRLTASTAVALLGGRLFGLEELYVLAATSATLVLGAVVYVRARRVVLVASRHLQPSRVTAGSSSGVDLEVRNAGRSRTPPLELIDGNRRLFLAALRPGAGHVSGYRFVAVRRGLVPVGPLEARVTDPFGMASTATGLLEPTILTVHPRRHEVLPPPRPLQGDPLTRLVRPVLTPERSDEFHALRPYQDGDDLRRIHWPSTARLDQLVVRQDELRPPWEVTVVLDLRRSRQDDRSAEEAVTAAASVVESSVLDDALVRLVVTGGADSGLGGGPAHLDAILDLLAAAELKGGAALFPTPLLEDVGGGTTVVISSNAVSDEDLLELRLAGQRAGTLVVVLLPAAVPGPAERFGDRPAVQGAIVQVPPEGAFAPFWDRAVASV